MLSEAVVCVPAQGCSRDQRNPGVVDASAAYIRCPECRCCRLARQMATLRDPCCQYGETRRHLSHHKEVPSRPFLEELRQRRIDTRAAADEIPYTDAPVSCRRSR